MRTQVIMISRGKQIKMSYSQRREIERLKTGLVQNASLNRSQKIVYSHLLKMKLVDFNKGVYTLKEKYSDIEYIQLRMRKPKDPPPVSTICRPRAVYSNPSHEQMIDRILNMAI